MGLVTELSNRNDVAMSIAAAIEHALGGELLLAVGLPRPEAPNHDLLPTGAARVVSIPFASGVGGGISLAVGEAMARTLEASATDESLLTARNEARWQDGSILRLMVAQLPQQQASLIELAFFEGMTHGEIAAALHLPLGTVKTRLRAGLQRLRDLWFESADQTSRQ